MRILILAAFTPFVACGASAYTVQVLQVPSGLTNLNLVGINNSGQVVGNGGVGLIYAQHVFIASPTNVVVVPSPPGWSNVEASAVNNAGQISGEAVFAGQDQAFIGTSSGIIPVPLPAGWPSSLSFAINDAGQIAGAVSDRLAIQ